MLIWNYHDVDLEAPPAEIAIEVAGIDDEAAHVVEYRMDAEHSNAYHTWLQMGSPQHLSEEQIRTMRRTGGLQVVREVDLSKGRAATLRVTGSLPRQAVALYQVTW